MLTEVLTSSPGFGDIVHNGDRELAGALLLAGAGGRLARSGRQCFQTTYLNERYDEYLAQPGPFRLVWLIRDPASVVYSMLYNWSRYALNEVFSGCVRHRGQSARAFTSAARRACLCYNAKNDQILELVSSGRIDATVVDYGDLVTAPERTFRKLCSRLDILYEPKVLGPVSPRSTEKAAALPRRTTDLVAELCGGSYRQVHELILRPDES